MRRIPPIVVVLGVLAIASGTAHAQGVATPPGNSEADQYFEAVPDSSGSSSPDYKRSPQSGVLSPSQQASLEKLGPKGKTAAASAIATAPPVTPAGTATEGAPDKQGLGGVFLLIVIAAPLAALAFFLGRRSISRRAE